MAGLSTGRMDRKITLQRPTVTKNAIGEPIESWTNVAVVWADRRGISNSERFQADATRAATTARFFIHWMSGIDSTMRVQVDGKNYRINGVNEVGYREGLELLAEIIE